MGTEVSEIYPELRKIENEIKEIKTLLLRSKKVPQKAIKLEGALKGFSAEEKEIEAAKSLLKFSV